jgi:4-hydroxy-tetrahydrodipicolinate synthase
VIGVKYEVGRPGAVGNFECFRRLAGKRVVVSDPFEANAPVWTELFGMQWVGTSNYEYYGSAVPTMFDLLRKGDRAAALDLYWKIQPARVMRASLQADFGGANFIHRYLWKYQGWLNGYNGGPLRQPTMKLADGQMRRAAEGLIKSGIIDRQPEDLGEYFQGRVAG